MDNIGIVANAIITSVFSLQGMRKYIYIVPLGVLSIFSYLASVPIIAYILSIMISYEVFEYKLSKIITQNSEHIYFGKIKAILTYGVPRKVYQEIHHYRLKKKTWFWRAIEKPLYIDLTSLPNRHILITGASGTGKSLLAKHLVLEIYKKYGHSFIIIDPHNEYKILRRYIPKINIVDASTLSINPLELGRLGPKEKAYQISSFISTLFKLGPIQRHLFADLILEVYRLKGIYPDKPETWSNKPPTIHDLLEFCQRLMSDNELYKKIYPYLRILADNVFSSTNISFYDLTKTPTIVTLNGLSSDFVKALYVNALLQRILDSMYIGELRKKLMIVLDEAYMFLRKGLSRNIVSKLLMESRKYGLGLIIISQQILAVPDPVVENSSIKIFFNTSEPKNLEYSSRIICSGCDKYGIIASKSALTNLKSYNYILSISGFNEIFIVNEEDIAQNMYAG
ncbi:ATP-binding protein [Staphylothermus hellenicus]|nr:ATP-binding protein [Staphylothermus hellenicus]